MHIKCKLWKKALILNANNTKRCDGIFQELIFLFIIWIRLYNIRISLHNLRITLHNLRISLHNLRSFRFLLLFFFWLNNDDSFNTLGLLKTMLELIFFYHLLVLVCWLRFLCWSNKWILYILVLLFCLFVLRFFFILFLFLFFGI